MKEFKKKIKSIMSMIGIIMKGNTFLMIGENGNDKIIILKGTHESSVKLIADACDRVPQFKTYLDLGLGYSEFKKGMKNIKDKGSIFDMVDKLFRDSNTDHYPLDCDNCNKKDSCPIVDEVKSAGMCRSQQEESFKEKVEKAAEKHKQDSAKTESKEEKKEG